MRLFLPVFGFVGIMLSQITAYAQPSDLEWIRPLLDPTIVEELGPDCDYECDMW